MLKANKTQHPLLDTPTIESLIINEENLLLKNASMNTIKQLIEIYSDLIIYYDQNRDPLNFYFKEKIQNLLSNKNILKILESENAKKKNEKKKIEKKINLSTKKELRHLSINFNEKLSQNFESEKKKSVSKILEKHHKSLKSINKHIKRENQNQEKNFEEKMKKRRERSFSRNLSRSLEVLRSSQIEGRSSRNFIFKLEGMREGQEDNPFEGENR